MTVITTSFSLYILIHTTSTSPISTYILWVVLSFVGFSPLSWFTRLPQHMIDTFETLAMKFSIQFITGRPHHLNSMALVNIRKETKESLRTSFMEHFGKVVFIIRNLDHEVSLHPWL